MPGGGGGRLVEARHRAGLAMLSGLLVAVLVATSSLGARIDGLHADLRQRLLRQYAPAPVSAAVTPVIVGIDKEDRDHFPEPFALWHRHLAAFIDAARRGGARVIVLDVVMPDRDFATVLPGADEDLLRALLAARGHTPVVLARTLDRDGRPRPLTRTIEVIAGDARIGLALFPRDVDGVVRRFDERLAENGAPVPTLVGQVARAVGVAATPGWIDFSRGEVFGYTPLREVLAWADDEARLRREFAGRIVLLGSASWREDVVAQPLSLAGWETDAGEMPGVVLQAQTLRNLFAGELVQDASPLLMPLLAAVGVALAWLVATPTRAVVLAVAWALALAGAAMVAWRSGWAVATAAPLFAGWAAIATRSGVDAAAQLRERWLLRRAFATSVSPPVLASILDGQITPHLGGERRLLCLLFSDVRGFTARSEAMSPEEAIALLNLYFESVVGPIHAEGGSVVNFMGDGIMAMFGAPQALPDSCDGALRAAQAMLAATARLNAELAREGKAAITIGIGLHAGEAVVGFVGAANRNDYTAIGDACNVASRVEGLSKELGFSVVVTEAVRERLADPSSLVPLGLQAIKGHSPVQVHGWGPSGAGSLA